MLAVLKHLETPDYMELWDGAGEIGQQLRVLVAVGGPGFNSPIHMAANKHL